MSARFEGRVAIVTGAASGIGAATARRFFAEGAALALCDLDEAGLEGLARELDGAGDRIWWQAFDVAERERVEAFTDAAAQRFGRLDIAFHNAGLAVPGRTPELDPAGWHRTLDVDLHAVFYGCRAAIPHLVAAGGGAIVNTASISGLGGDAGLAAYNAAKGALVNYTRTLALDHGGEGIRANAVCPGLIETGLSRALLENRELMQAYGERIPLGRAGRAEEVAGVVAFLASEDASYLTGATLVVDGGLTASTGQPFFPRYLGRA